MAFGHVILREFHLDRQVPYFDEYCRKYTDMPLLVRLDKKGDHYVAGRQLRASDLADNLGESNNPDWKTIGIDRHSKELVVPNGSVGFRWGEQGKWNLEEQAQGKEVSLQLSLIDAADHDEVVTVDFPYFGGRPLMILWSMHAARCSVARYPPSASPLPMAMRPW